MWRGVSVVSEQSVLVPSVLTEENGSARSLILNRPKSINAIDHEMVTEIAERLDAWSGDDAVEAVVLYGAGERGLCAGGDIVAIHRDASALSGNPDSTDVDAENSPSAKFWFDEYRLNAAISRYPKSYVAIMDGIVMGGGVGVSAHGNIRIVTDRTRLAMPEVGIGFVPRCRWHTSALACSRRARPLRRPHRGSPPRRRRTGHGTRRPLRPLGLAARVHRGHRDLRGGRRGDQAVRHRRSRVGARRAA